MKRLLASKVTQLAVFAIGLLLMGFLLSNAIGYVFNVKSLSVFSAATEIDKYEIRSSLLMDATNEIGASSPELAADAWADGLKKRSAALQYAVMTNSLKSQYAAQLDTTYPNWVTGVSSPWVDKYEVVRQMGMNADWASIHLRIMTKTSTGPAASYNAVLSVVQQGGYWRIAAIDADPGLKVYTGFK